MQKLKLEFIMALKKGVVEMKKIIFIIAGIVAMTFLVIWGFETKQMQIVSIEENYEEMEVITENVKDFAEVEFEEEQQETTEETTTETESVISQKETEKSEVVSQQKQEQKSKNENKTSAKEEDKSNNTQQTESNTSIPVEKVVEKEQEIIEEKPQEEVKDEVKEEIVVEEKQVDEEYERLLKEVEYATYDECLKAGFEIAFSDTVNILGFDPIEVIYKGKVIGYKLKINYTNPMEN